MRMEQDRLSARDAVDAVLRENIYGLELDQRCVELAAFALALTAWKYPSAGGYRVLPELNVACSGLSVSVAKEEWKQLGLGKKNLTIALDWMHDTFKDAPVLGSLLNPAKTDAAKLVQWDELSNALEQALKQEQSEEQQEAAVVAQGLAKAATLLAGRYQWVITNVPYLLRRKQTARLQNFCDRYYPAAKNDLATVFLDRCLELCVENGTSSIVLPQNWLFLASYKIFREKLLKNNKFHLISNLGSGAFDTITGEIVKAILINISSGCNQDQSAGLFSTHQKEKLFFGIDVSEARNVVEKSEQLKINIPAKLVQSSQLKNPGTVISFSVVSGRLLEEYATPRTGLQTGDNDKFSLAFWEVYPLGNPWALFQRTAEITKHYAGARQILRWHPDGKEIKSNPSSAIRGIDCCGSKGILVHRMGALPATLYLGEIFDQNGATFIFKSEDNIVPVWCYNSSTLFNENVRKLDTKLGVTPATLGRASYDHDHWTKVAQEKYPNGLPNPYSDDPTQWIFHGHPAGSVIWDEATKWTATAPLRTDDTVLHIAVARLLGYRWPAELDADMELAEEQRGWVNRCEALLPFADDDGIVCIPPVRGEASATERLLDLLAAAYGDAWSNDILSQLLANANHAGKSLETWLRDKFFPQHCKLFKHRPFIWQIWDGLNDGFSALVNYHKLDYKNLETLTYTYLGDWITRQKQDIASGIDGAQERLAAAEALKKKLELILEGEAPHDIFVRWKPLAQQPIGWNPDLNDGVRLNIRPFMTVGDIKKKDAGILRDKPNIKWGKDRGKDVESAPWYRLGLEYDGKEGDRINDHHLSLAEKQAAREAMKSSS
jgi:hypothetical protein